ncbi:MAG: hypothetical protein ACYSTL_01820 [Planctomycetota bacterium]|jgi:hypothetical protein
MTIRLMNNAIALALAALPVLPAGCRKPVHFPANSNSELAAAVKATGAYDANGDGKVEFFTYADAAGRIDRIAYDVTGDEEPDEIVSLDAIAFASARHLVLILDGLAYDLVREHYDAGNLRMFYPPSRVVAPYPSMTDPCIQDALAGMPCRAVEARYFDRRDNRIRGGQSDYLAGKNEPYNRIMQYRAGTLWDAIGYIDPWAVFGKEINDAKRIFDRAETVEMLAYFVSSAGMGTQFGADGQKRCLERVEQFVNQVLWETRGLTKVTLLSDHGHSYTPGKRIDFTRHLREKNWRVAGSLRDEKDVVPIEFGLVTFAGFATRDPEALAAELTGVEGVELASYIDGESVVVLSPGGQRAVIRRKGNRYIYQPATGDPLKLKDILASLEAGPDGTYDPDELLEATLTGEYPAPLQRLWRAHFALVENPPDVIVSLSDGYYAGMASFAGSVKVASTHGSLNYTNSVTFIMSTAGALPPYMRSGDIPAHMKALSGADFPMGE